MYDVLIMFQLKENCPGRVPDGGAGSGILCGWPTRAAPGGGSRHVPGHYDPGMMGRRTKNAAVERREACALRHWARNASLRCSGARRSVRQGAAIRTGASRRFHLLLFIRALVARGGGALAYANDRRLFDIVKHDRMP